MRVKDLTVDELKILIRETVTDTLLDLINQREPEQEAHLESKPALSPQEAASSHPNTPQPPSQSHSSDHIDIPVKEVAKDLGLIFD